MPVILAGFHSSGGERCLLGFITGAIALIGIHYWLFEISSFGWIQAVVLELIYAGFYLFWTWGLFYLNKNSFSIYLLAFYWVILEYIRSHLGFMANPFATLAQSQSENLPLLQLASITGEYGISFLLVLINLALAKWIITSTLDKQIILAVLLVMAVHFWGLVKIQQKPDNFKTIKIAAIQPCLSRKEVQMINGDEIRLLRLEKLTLSIMTQDPDLIVWPESALKNLNSNKRLYNRLKSFGQFLNKPIITGVSVFNYSVTPPTPKEPAQDYNAAYFLPPGKDSYPPYFKNILLPFGEYLPWRNNFAWPDWLILDDFNLSPGTSISSFPLKDDLNFSVLICWENLFAKFVRRLVQQDTGIMIHLVNDNWFGQTAAPRQHNLASILRAVENRVPIVVASNTGPSIIIDSQGRIISSLSAIFHQGAMISEVQAFQQKTIYNRFGDWFVVLAATIIIFHIARLKSKST